MNLLGGKTGGRFPVKKNRHTSDSARTHTSMRVLLRHSRHIYSCVPRALSHPTLPGSMKYEQDRGTATRRPQSS